ncbi:MAG: hypothetical protein HYV28_12430 [Ignavibacteriales bacterium]|nr:hypothetical protein [Ignavibacteriales bacterium]
MKKKFLIFFIIALLIIAVVFISKGFNKSDPQKVLHALKRDNYYQNFVNWYIAWRPDEYYFLLSDSNKSTVEFGFDKWNRKIDVFPGQEEEIVKYLKLTKRDTSVQGKKILFDKLQSLMIFCDDNGIQCFSGNEKSISFSLNDSTEIVRFEEINKNLFYDLFRFNRIVQKLDTNWYLLIRDR